MTWKYLKNLVAECGSGGHDKKSSIHWLKLPCWPRLINSTLTNTLWEYLPQAHTFPIPTILSALSSLKGSLCLLWTVLCFTPWAVSLWAPSDERRTWPWGTSLSPARSPAAPCSAVRRSTAGSPCWSWSWRSCWACRGRSAVTQVTCFQSQHQTTDSAYFIHQ